MMNQITPIICEACGVTMNAHAEKPVVPIGADDAADAQADLGIVIEEIHQCPQCARIRSARSRISDR